MEQAVKVMRQSVPEPRKDGKASPRVGAVLVKPDGAIEKACGGELRHGDHAEFTLLDMNKTINTSSPATGVIASFFLVFSCTIVSGYALAQENAGVPSVEPRAKTIMSPEAKSLANRLLNVFESGQADRNYSYIGWFNDDGGYTMGTGFLTSQGEIGKILQAVDMMKKDWPAAEVPRLNAVLKYLVPLTTPAAEGGVIGLSKKSEKATADRRLGISKDYGVLDEDGGTTFGEPTGFLKAWINASSTTMLQRAHDKLLDEKYLAPAEALALKLGFKLPYSVAVLYDTGVLQGYGDAESDPAYNDDVWSVLKRTDKQVSRADEKAWIRVFLAERYKALVCSRPDEETGELPDVAVAWVVANNRVIVMKKIAERVDWSFKQKVTETAYHYGIEFDMISSTNVDPTGTEPKPDLTGTSCK